MYAVYIAFEEKSVNQNFLFINCIKNKVIVMLKYIVTTPLTTNVLKM